jgi:hypothetical protein
MLKHSIKQNPMPFGKGNIILYPNEEEVTEFAIASMRDIINKSICDYPNLANILEWGIRYGTNAHYKPCYETVLG